MAWSISLRLSHPDVDARALDAATGLVAVHAWSAGAPRATRSGMPLEGVHSDSYACYALGRGESFGIGPAIASALDRIEPMAAALDALGPQLRREFFVGWWVRNGAGGDVLAPELLGRLARCGIALSFDLYIRDADGGE